VEVTGNRSRSNMCSRQHEK